MRNRYISMRVARAALLCAAVFAAVLLSAGISPCESWTEARGEHFLVYYADDEKFANDILDKAELYYRTIAPDLGYPRYSEFWTWDSRVKIYIHPNKESYKKFAESQGHPDWAVGMADYFNKTITSYNLNEQFNTTVLPHEIAHLIFRDFVGFKGVIPLWLDEGVAQWEEGEATRARVNEIVKGLYESNSLLTLKDITELKLEFFSDPNKLYIRPSITKKGETTVIFINGSTFVNTYYVESASIVGFLIIKYGSLRFSEFCRELRDGKTVEAALAGAYADHLEGVAQLEEKWRLYLSGKE